MVMEVLHEEMGEGSMQCMNHLYGNSIPGGICAFCLQEKLGKLVSSSFSGGVLPSSASSETSFRSDFGGTTTSAGADALQSHHFVSSATNTGSVKYNDIGYYNRRSRLSFIMTQRRKKKKEDEAITCSDSKSVVFKRSKSTSTLRNGVQFLNDKNNSGDFNRQKSGFWSFRFLSKHSTDKKAGKNFKDVNFPSATHSTVSSSTVIISSSVNNCGAAVLSRNREDLAVVVDENGSPDEVSFERKVSRSRSVGCGSRSFSGDFFERISTGFGDCTLRRVESQREGKAKVTSLHRNGVNNTNNGEDYMKERVKCGGIFSGLIIPSSSSSSSSSNEDNNLHGKSISAAHSSVRNPSHVRSKSWGWTFSSPMRAFGKLSTGKSVDVSSKNGAPNLAEIPSLLAASG